MKAFLSLLLLLPISFFGCAVPGQTPSVADICSNPEGKVVAFNATFGGWKCSSDRCGAPPLTRSDVCIYLSGGCLYMTSSGGLDPVSDVGKKVYVKAIVQKRGKRCYLKPLEVKPIK